MLGEFFNKRPVVVGDAGAYVKLYNRFYLNYQHKGRCFYIDVWLEKSKTLKILIEFKPKNPEVFVTIFKQLDERVGHAW